MNTFSNLHTLATLLGFPGITLEFLQEMKRQPGAFTRLAATHGRPEIGPAAKREFLAFMEQGAQMFAPVEAPTACAWFALCDRAATGTTPHPILGDVPTCDHCHRFATGETR